jgi:hypothetical protein
MNKYEDIDIRQEHISPDGLKNLYVSDPAKRTEISEGAISLHFRTKQDIIVSKIYDVQKDFIIHLRNIAASTDGQQILLEKFIHITVEYLTSKTGITVLPFSEVSYNKDKFLKEILFQIFNNPKKLIGKIILDGIAAAKWDKTIPVVYAGILYTGIPVSPNVELMINDGEIYPQEFSYRMLKPLLKPRSKS